MALAGLTVPVFLKDISGSGMRLWVPHPLPCGTKISIKTRDITSFGEVCRCDLNADGSAMAGIQIFRSNAAAEEQTATPAFEEPLQPVYERLRFKD